MKTLPDGWIKITERLLLAPIKPVAPTHDEWMLDECDWGPDPITRLKAKKEANGL